MWIILLMALDWKAFESEPFDRQKAFILDAINPKYQTVAAFSGLQGGKTLCGADADYACLYGPNPVTLPPHLVNKTPGEFWIISKDYRLARVALDTFRMRTAPEFWLTDKQCKKLGLKRHDQDTYWLAPRSDCVDTLPVCLRVRTASDPEAMRATPNLMLAHCDEIAHWKDMTWRNLQGRAIVAKTKFIITTTPKGKNWLYRDVAVPGGYALPGSVGIHSDKTISVHTWRSVDNPYADQEYLQKLRLKFGPEYAQQELDAMFITSAGYVYDFDRTVHMQAIPSQDPKHYKARVIGVDPGYGDPYAAGVWLKDWNNHWWLADEMYLPSKAIFDDAVPWLNKQCKQWEIEKIYVDKRRPSDWEGLRRRKLPAVPNVDVFGEDGQRTVMPMIRMVQRLFREGRIHFAPHCEWHAEEYENYAFKDSEEKNAGENPVDFKNHTTDADRYAICSVDALPEDRRPRYRSGEDQMPRARGKNPSVNPNVPQPIPSARDYLMAQEKRFEAARQPGRRQRT